MWISKGEAWRGDLERGNRSKPWLPGLQGYLSWWRQMNNNAIKISKLGSLATLAFFRDFSEGEGIPCFLLATPKTAAVMLRWQSNKAIHTPVSHTGPVSSSLLSWATSDSEGSKWKWVLLVWESGVEPERKLDFQNSYVRGKNLWFQMCLAKFLCLCQRLVPCDISLPIKLIPTV